MGCMWLPSHHLCPEFSILTVPLVYFWIFYSADDSKKYIFEAEVEPEFLDDVIETDDPGHEGEKERAIIYAAERLMQIGDAVQREKEQTSGV